MEKSPEEKLKQEKMLQTAQKIWMIVTPIFAILLLFNLYRWTQGKDALSSILSMSGMTFVGLATIIGSRNKPLTYVFLTLGIISVFIGLIVVIMSLMD